MNKKLKLLLCLGAAAVLGGCMQATQPEERAIVQAAAIDLAEEGCIVTLQIYDPDPTQQEQDGDNAYRLLRGQGESPTAAFSRAAEAGQELYLGSCRLLLAGQSAAPQLEELLGFFNTRPQTRATTLVGLVRGSAGELLGICDGAASPSPAAAAEQILALAQKEKRLPPCRMMDLLAAAGTGGRDGVVPLLEVQGSGDEAAPALAGSVVLPDGLELTSEETALLGLCRRGRGSLVLALANDVAEEQGAVVLLEQFSPGLEAQLQQGLPQLTVELNIKGRLSEWARGAAAQPTAQESAALESAAAQQLAGRLNDLLQKLCVAGCDPLRFGERLRRADFAAWQQCESSWPQLLARAGWEIRVNLRLSPNGS